MDEVYYEFNDNSSWDEEHEMTLWYNDEVYKERFYEEWEIKGNCRLLIMKLQQGNEVMTPLDEVLHEVPNLDHEDPCSAINHPEPDCTKPLNGNSNEASSWMNIASKNKWSCA
ncbi:hypothetical protein PVK06_011326 [Gossypium arboreum]|uniref:Uncharacterized protein n=1 Tax=Gossypium arboreum TaxID=29729 RepID=A0ABR0Q8N8_GOSAR|nr:hypothetical protein PVK06_011326 [Gossypium arboreum]